MNQREPSQETPGRSSGLERALDRLEVDLRKLQIDFERFFNGALPTPPEDFRLSLQDRLRFLREAKSQTSADRFRLGGLEARFNSYSELFHRRLRDREEGRVAGLAAVAPPDSSGYDTRAGVLVEGRISPEIAEALYTGLASGGEPPRFDLHAFGQYLQRQADSIRQKTDCKKVRFRLEESEGKVRLKARPIRDEDE